MRLIDDTLTKLDVWDLFNSTYNDASRFTEEETKFAKRILSEVQEQIDNQTTAFDLERAIEQLEEKRDYCYAEMKKQENKDIQEVEPLYFEQMHNQGMAYNNALEILKSSANATNGKNGG